jgi:hypothetical protein
MQLGIAKCQKCDKTLMVSVNDFNDKDLWIRLEIQRFYSMCDKCCHPKDMKYDLYFCTKECLKDYVVNDLDSYIEDEVYWGKLLKQMEEMNKNAAIV